MTLDRKGSCFNEFFSKIFSKVSQGKTLPIAWNEIAPQIPQERHEDIPNTLAIMGAGNVILLGDKLK